MKIVVISDTHIPDRASALPAAFLEMTKDADLFIHAGDFVNISVIKELEKIAPVKAVWGNMDPLDVRKLLKQKEIVRIGSISIGIMHGTGKPSDLTKILQEEFKDELLNIIIFGHSHEPFNRRIGGILFFNPGSLTDKFHSGFFSFGVITINGGGFSARIEKLSEE